MKKDFNPWPYGLVGVLVIFCTIQLSLVTMATTTFEGLEDVEYYRAGVEYGKELERKEKQRSLEWTVDHNLDQATHIKGPFPLRVALLDCDKKPIQHAKVQITVGRPATKRQDFARKLKEVGPGIYACDIDLTKGNWRLELEALKGDNLVKVKFRHRVEAVESGPATGKPVVLASPSVVSEGQ